MRMPRRREVTVEGLDFAWNADGSVASERGAALSRPMAHELGRVMLALTAARELADARAPRAPKDAPAALTTLDIAHQTGLSEREARAALRELLPTGCIVRFRVRFGRQRDYARWAHGFQLAPERDVRGPGRRPRLSQMALVVEPSVVCGDLIDVLMRRTGVLAVQARSGADAQRLLRRFGFEVVLADADAASEAPGLAALTRLARAAGCGPLLLLERSGLPLSYPITGSARLVAADRGAAATDRLARVAGHPAALRKPFTPEGFEAVLQRLLGLGVPPPAHEMSAAAELIGV
jgi:hypothetical protein